MDRMIVRRNYIDLLSAGRGDTGIIKVITGMRRCGKSVLMMQYMDYLISSGVPREDILHIDFERLEWQNVSTKDELNEIIKDAVPRDRIFYVFFDEIQNVKGWELSVSALNHMGNVDVYITGSNSDMLSSQLATHISGRYVEIKVFPLSLKEFMELNGYSDRDAAFNEYMRYGGLPAIDPSRGWRYSTDYLFGVFSTVVIKDVQGHVRVTDSSKVESISRFLFDNVGNITNTSSISSATGFSTNTVDAYLNAMTDAFLFSVCPRYDMVGKKLLKTNGKYYAMDLGVRNAVLDISADSDISRPLENLVYIELLRRGYKVRVGSYRDAEVDFLAKRGDSVEFFQICQTLMAEGTRKREVRALERTKDNYPKTILTLDRYGLGNDDGIRIMNVLDWLLSE